MSVTSIQQSIENLNNYLSEHTEKCRHPDKAVTAVLEEGLCCRVEGLKGTTVVTDMPKSIGGGGLRRRRAGSCVPPWLPVIPR